MLTFGIGKLRLLNASYAAPPGAISWPANIHFPSARSASDILDRWAGLLPALATTTRRS